MGPINSCHSRGGRPRLEAMHFFLPPARASWSCSPGDGTGNSVSLLSFYFLSSPYTLTPNLRVFDKYSISWKQPLGLASGLLDQTMAPGKLLAKEAFLLWSAPPNHDHPSPPNTEAPPQQRVEETPNPQGSGTQG